MSEGLRLVDALHERVVERLLAPSWRYHTEVDTGTVFMTLATAVLILDEHPELFERLTQYLSREEG